MSNYDFLKPRERKKSLFVVEGDHEKDVLVHLLLKVFPEIDIAEEDTQRGVIKVLNTGVFFVADYKISLIG